jgi:branched-chain amino acid transport system permease protein
MANAPRRMAASSEPAAPFNLAAAVKDAALTTLVAALLCFPLFAFKAEEAQPSLVLKSRWGLVAVLLALTFLGRMAMSAWTARGGAYRGGGAAVGSSAGGRAWTGAAARIAPYSMWLLLGFLIILPFLPSMDRYELDLAILVLTYVMLGWGLNIVVGLAGLLDLGYVAFYAVGAYSYALLAQYFGFSFWICLPLAGILAAFWGVLLGFPVLRLRGDYLAIVTLAFGEIIRIILINWQSFTGGPNGVSGIPRPSFFGLEFKNDCEARTTFCGFFKIEHSNLYRLIFLYYLILALVLLTNWVTIRLRRLPVGRAWEALREDEIACRSLGINTVTTKLTAFAIGAMFAGFAGSFFATKQGFISPESFVFMESAIILAIVVLGGMGSQMGVAAAAVAVNLLPEALRNLQFMKTGIPLIGWRGLGSDFDPTQYRMLLFGLAMVALMVFRPRGFVGNRTPSIVLKESKVISGDLVKEGHG